MDNMIPMKVGKIAEKRMKEPIKIGHTTDFTDIKEALNKMRVQQLVAKYNIKSTGDMKQQIMKMKEERLSKKEQEYLDILKVEY